MPTSPAIRPATWSSSCAGSSTRASRRRRRFPTLRCLQNWSCGSRSNSSECGNELIRRGRPSCLPLRLLVPPAPLPSTALPCVPALQVARGPPDQRDEQHHQHGEKEKLYLQQQQAVGPL